MSSEDEQDACNVCEGDNSPNKNPIIFCDGKGCNMPVHKRCYGLKQVPGGDWFCQRCENKKRKKATNIVCCSVQTGAVKKTKLQDKYMHIVCALWNKDIDNTLEPYPVPEDQLNKHACGFCLKKVGLCIHCEEPGCSERWHVTCAINNNIITPAASVPASFSPRCVKHEIKSNKNKASTSTSSTSTPLKKKSRRLIKSKKISDSEDSDEEDDDFEGEEDDDDEDDDDDDEEEEEEEEEEDEDIEQDQGKKKEDKSKIKSDTDNKKEEDESSSSSGSSGAFNNQLHAKKVLAIGNKLPSSSSAVSSGLSSPSTIRSPSLKKEIPMKRRLSPNSLFGQDQSSDDSDDDMGTKSRPKSTNSNASSNTNNNKSLTSMSSKHAERIEAKRKKSGLESTSSASLSSSTRTSLLEDIKKPAASLTPPLPTGTPTKQKLPNKAHLLNNISNSTAITTTNILNPSTNANTPLSSSTANGTGIRPVLTPPIKKQNGPGIIKDIDEIQNDIRAGAQRWNNSSSTPLHHPQPTTPHSISTTFFENDGKRMDNNRKSMNGGDKEELLRMREENRKLIEFKRTVTEVLTNLNVPLQSGLLPSADVDNYVVQLQLLLKRVGPIRENERVQIQECVKGALQHNNHQQQ